LKINFSLIILKNNDIIIKLLGPCEVKSAYNAVLLMLKAYFMHKIPAVTNEQYSTIASTNTCDLNIKMLYLLPADVKIIKLIKRDCYP
jgi:hypothetical protein